MTTEIFYYLDGENVGSRDYAQQHLLNEELIGVFPDGSEVRSTIGKLISKKLSQHKGLAAAVVYESETGAITILIETADGASRA